MCKFVFVSILSNIFKYDEDLVESVVFFISNSGGITTYSIQHTQHTACTRIHIPQGATSHPYRNHHTYVQEMQDKTRHPRKGPTAPMRREYPFHANTMTDMETHIEILKVKINVSTTNM